MEETKISFNYLFRSFKRNWTFLLYFIVCFFAIGCVYSVFFNTPSYKSEGILSTANNSTITQKAQEIIESDITIADSVQQKVAEAGITHENGSVIDLSEIRNGITISADLTLFQLKISYTNSDSSVVQIILDKFLETSEEKINKIQSTYNVSIASPATEPVNVAHSNVKILLLFTAAGVCIGVVAAIISEIRQNLIYEPADIEYMNVNTFEITYDKEKNTNAII